MFKKKQQETVEEQKEETKEEAPETEKKEEAVPEEEKYIQVLKEDYKKLTEAADVKEKEKEEWKNKAYQAYADMANLRKSLEADHRNALRFRAEGFIENLLPALDSFYWALSAEPNSQEAKNYQQGFSFIYNQIKSALENEGVAEVLPKVGDEFDPNSMHAMELEETEGESNKVTMVMKKGYRLHEKLIAPAMVKVSKKKEEPKPEEAPAPSEETNESNKA